MNPDLPRIQLNSDAIQRGGLSCIVCALPANVLLLTGYWPIIGTSIAVSGPDGQIILIAPEDERKLAENGWATQIHYFHPASLDHLQSICQVIDAPLRDAILKVNPNPRKIGCELDTRHEPSSYIAMQLYGPALQHTVGQVLPAAQVISADDLLMKLRSVQTPWGLEQIRHACRIAARAYQAAPAQLQVGFTEVYAAANITLALHDPTVPRSNGHIGVVSGVNSARAFGAYARSTSKPLESGDLALVHCNSTANGYWTDITRTFLLASPDPRRRKMYDALFAARAAAIAAVHPGARAADVDAAARTVLADAGFGSAFRHPTGHGVGFAAIDHNAQPRLHPRSPDILEPGMVFNIEPAIYLDGQDGMRHCDMVAVTEDGCELLTPFLQTIDELILPR